jgi:malic enzyme
VQGTAAVTLAGLYAAMLAQDKPLSDLCKQRFVVVGAGSAGTGIADMAAQAMSKHVRMFPPSCSSGPSWHWDLGGCLC